MCVVTCSYGPSNMEDSYGFGVSGSRVKAEPSTSAPRCPVCKKRYGTGRFSCNCGVKKKGA